MTPEEVTRQLQAVANEFKAISGKPTNSDLQNIYKTSQKPFILFSSISHTMNGQNRNQPGKIS